MNQLLFRFVLTGLLALGLAGCASGPSPSASENKKIISSTAEAIPPGKGLPPAMTKPTPPPKPRKVRVVSQPKRRLGPDETEQFAKKAFNLLAPFQISDIAKRDLGGAITTWTPIPVAGIILGTASKTRDDGTTVTVESIVRGEAVQQVVVYHKTGDISSIDLKNDNRGKRVIAFIDANPDPKSNRLRFNVVMIFEDDHTEHQYVYLMGMGLWSYEVYKYELRK
jgi:hypothetical protein